jgi:hypothetical protein
MIAANQSFDLIPPTFSMFPVMAGFGMGCVTKPMEGVKSSVVRYWLSHETTTAL